MNHHFKALSLTVLVMLLLTFFTLPPPAAAQKTKEVENAVKFCGVWEYESKQDGKGYIRVTREGDRFRFFRGQKYEGKIDWQEPMLKNARAIYLKPSKGKLQGKFVSGNFYATHGEDFTYKITLDMKSDNKLVYSVWSSIRGGTDKAEATKISD